MSSKLSQTHIRIQTERPREKARKGKESMKFLHFTPTKRNFLVAVNVIAQLQKSASNRTNGTWKKRDNEIRTVDLKPHRNLHRFEQKKVCPTERKKHTANGDALYSLLSSVPPTHTVEGAEEWKKEKNST